MRPSRRGRGRSCWRTRSASRSTSTPSWSSSKAHDLWFVEDNCDALGSTLSRPADRDVRPPRDLVLLSGPPHHDRRGRHGRHRATSALARIARSIRDWGRDCYCAGGENNTCGKRFSQQFGSLPYGYDHKYVYSHLGYNLKATDMQAAIGVRPARAARRRSSPRASATTPGCSRRSARSRIGCILPVAPPHTDPSWFGFVITVREDAGFTRAELTGVPRGQSDRDARACSAATCCGTRPSRPSSAASSATWRTPTSS